MKNLQIGDRVVCRSTAEPTYTDNERTIQNYPCEPFEGVVTGRVRRQEGTYCGASKSYGYFGEEHDPPYLSVSKVVRLWEVRKHVDAKPVLVSDDQLEVLLREYAPALT